MQERDAGDGSVRGRAYDRVEGLHLRQWLLRAVLPLAVIATNGAGPVEVSWLPRHESPFPLPPGAAAACLLSGALLVALSAWLRVLAKGVLVRKTTVTTGGIYRLVRHPFYLANLLGAAGTLLLAGPLGGVLAALWLVAAAPVYGITVAGEEEGLARLHRSAWRAYAARVPALLPRPGRLGPADANAASVTWRNLVDEREPPRLARFLAGALLVTGLGPASGHVGTVAAGAGLYVLSYLLPLVTGGGRRSRRRASAAPDRSELEPAAAEGSPRPDG